ncbi:MAG: bifunctional isocitrate dehydrogenase kinase/phosphatase [Proteobacteria bacterium]|nr:bifunctional isocitrate dehydrogenase kinase/phosphatase [Pseudomonadota bacterium]MCL2309114.1 bifunctional isocitrate dehydrogenase kinase/phosphatase [Pseudomonadota bacterium]
METLVAHTILQGFDAQYGRFLEITAGAQRRFENADWPSVQIAMRQRIHLYDHHVGLSAELIRRMAGDRCHDAVFLARVKEHYTTLLPNYPRFEIAESYFNSVYCRLFEHRDLAQDKMFVFSSQPEYRRRDLPRPISINFPLAAGVEERIRVILRNSPLRLPWENLPRDIADIADVLNRRFGQDALKSGVLEIYNEVFYRNKSAWIVGKLRLSDGIMYPFLLPISRSDSGELYVDACLTEFSDASIVFSFNRAYFMVYAPLPAATVEWLRELLPHKTTAELYTAIGCQKHAKTEYYREYLRHLEQTTDKFTIAPGTRGMVMLVFTLPSYDAVFKVIKDRFAPQKNVDADRVRACYQLVKEHDRVGRMADTQEYENFALEKNRVDDELMAELQREIPEKLDDLGDRILIRHLYLEQRMIPLNLYLDQVDETARAEIIDDYGVAIRQLASANIFPGDMLLKNFGVTKNNRVVFYDYDEIRYMTEMNFRAIPPPRYPEDELAGEPWYSVAENDVFPEEFRQFLFNDDTLRKAFEKHHEDIFHPEYWKRLQQRIREGVIEDFFAYRRTQRFRQR